MFPDFIGQTFEKDGECFFTTAISDQMTCSKDGMSDFNGFTLHECRHFPCEKIKELNKKFGTGNQK